MLLRTVPVLDSEEIEPYPCQCCGRVCITRTELATHICILHKPVPEPEPMKWLSDEETRQAIRDEYATGETSYKKLGEKYGVSNVTIANLVNNKRANTWLSDAEREAICQEYRNGGINIPRLAEKYGTSTNTVGRILKRAKVKR